jgi:glucose/arabinose dehydrogenase
VWAVLCLASLLFAPSAGAAGGAAPASTEVGLTLLPDHFYDEAIATELDQVIALSFLPDGRLLFAEQKSGRVRMIVDGHLATTDPIMTVDSIATAGEEWGLMGLAVDPRWPALPYVYLAYDALGGSIRISRYTATGDLDSPGSGQLALDPASRHDILRGAPDAQFGHNGGCMRFGIDGMLYVSLGDDQINCTAQDTTALAGVILRVDVSKLPPTPTLQPEEDLLVPSDNPLATHAKPHARLVWAMGFRNPFRFSIDRLDGSLFIADVGWTLWEEINHATTPGQNFGWPYYEGPRSYLASCPQATTPQTLTSAVFLMYRGGTPATSVIGGPLYRHPASCGTGCGFPAEYDGDYFFSEYYTGALRRLRYESGSWSLAPPVPGQPSVEDWGQGLHQVVDYAIAPDGAIWYARLAIDYYRDTGEIHRIGYATPGTGAEDDRTAPGIEFAAPYPIPARSGVRFEYALPEAGRVTLTVLDVQGRVVRTLLDSAARSAGRHDASWDGRADHGRPAAPGVYLARLAFGGRTITHRIAWAP